MAFNAIPSIGSDASIAASAENAYASNGGGEKKKSAKVLRYPLKRIESNSDYLEITAVKYEPPGFIAVSETKAGLADIGNATDNIKAKTEIKTRILLPIPQNLSDTNSITWGDDTLNPLEAFGLSAGTAPGETFKKFVEIYKSGVGAQVSESISSNQAAITATIGGALYNAVGGNVSIQGVISRATGQVLNPNLELLFQGSNIRSFPFTFDFAPRDQREAKEVKEIIRMFKRHMIPKNTSSGSLGKIFIGSPEVFLIKYKTGNRDHPFLNKFKPCALTDMQLSYTGSGTYATYQDGTPVHITMSLTFKELNPIYSEDYDELDSKKDTSVGY